MADNTGFDNSGAGVGTQAPPATGTQGLLAKAVAATKEAANSPAYAGKVVALMTAGTVGGGSSPTYLQRTGAGVQTDYMLFGFVGCWGAKPQSQSYEGLATASGYTVEHLKTLTNDSIFALLVEHGLYDLELAEVDLKGTTLQVPDEIEGLPRVGGRLGATGLDEYLLSQHGKRCFLLVAFEPEVSLTDLTFGDGNGGTSVIARNITYIGSFDAPGLDKSSMTMSDRMEAGRKGLASSIQRRTSGPRSGYGGGINATINIQVPNTSGVATEPAGAPAGNMME